MSFERFKLIINAKEGDDLELGNSEDAPSEECINAVENQLGVVLPKSYKWFLMNYGSATLFGEEIYSIYCPQDKEVVLVGDIMSNYYANLEKSLIEPYEIPIYVDEFSQMFVMDSSKIEKEEYPIYLKYSDSGDNKLFYADNFLSFFEKQLQDIAV